MVTTGFRFLHAADLHIDSPLDGLERYAEAPVAEIRAATRRAFDNLVQHAIEQQVAFVILAGDIFDGNWRDYGTGLWFASRLRELTKHGIRVYLLAGNHDADGRMTMSLPYPDLVFRFDTKAPQSFVDSPTGAVLHGQGFAKVAVTEDLTAMYPGPTSGEFNIGVLHTALAGRVGHEPYAPCTSHALANKGYDYWALGHVHQREVVGQNPWIVFPGNLQARHVREPGAKGATMVTVIDRRITEVKHQPLDVLRFARVPVDLSTCASVRACGDAVGAAMAAARKEADGRLLAVRIELNGRTAMDARLRRDPADLVALCRERANDLGNLWVEKVNLATRGIGLAEGNDIVEGLDLDDKELRAKAEEYLAKLPK